MSYYISYIYEVLKNLENASSANTGDEVLNYLFKAKRLVQPHTTLGNVLKERGNKYPPEVVDHVLRVYIELLTVHAQMHVQYCEWPQVLLYSHHVYQRSFQLSSPTVSEDAACEMIRAYLKLNKYQKAVEVYNRLVKDLSDYHQRLPQPQTGQLISQYLQAVA